MSARYRPKKPAGTQHNIGPHHALGNGAPQQGQPPRPQARPLTSVHLKPTDITISKSLEEKFPDKVGLFNKLKTKERELDLMINKKLLDIQDYQQSIAGGFSQEDAEDTDILRIFIYNTSENQPWQVENDDNESTATPAAQPCWTLRIEGRLLGDNEPIDSPKRRKFSTFLSSLSVELKSKDGKDNDLIIKAAPSVGNEGTDTRIVEWHDDPQLPEQERIRKQFDGLDIRRGGSSIPQSEVPEGETVEPSEKEVVANIVIQPKMYPIKLQILKDSLIELLGTNETSQSDCIHKLFNYVKVNNLFEVQNPPPKDASDRQQSGQQQKVVTIKADDLLYRIFGVNKLTLSQMMEILSTKLLKPIEPIKIQYSINTLRNTTLGEVVIDLKVNSKLIDPNVKPGAEEMASINKLLTEHVMNKQSLEELARLNDNLRLNMQVLNYSKMKYDFYKKLSEDPVGFLNTVQDRNNEYLKIISSDSMSFGANGMIDEEIVRRSEFYTDEFLSQHIGLLLNSGRM
ncbi:DEKNAAC104148 [Brettanomyces naardenensis]|uniref:DEKNAAC104148 n=1 Tax=Brettanomyces naardenensis TaxID=13370 RepID=A0A448YQE4_BRENA|nr:DEKNAAC104148 [Brettanomyces naardenensis]